MGRDDCRRFRPGALPIAAAAAPLLEMGADVPRLEAGRPIVVLRACEVGQNTTLMLKLAAAWNVTVIAGRGAGTSSTTRTSAATSR
jgi:hypothetical protein